MVDHGRPVYSLCRRALELKPAVSWMPRMVVLRCPYLGLGWAGAVANAEGYAIEARAVEDYRLASPGSTIVRLPHQLAEVSVDQKAYVDKVRHVLKQVFACADLPRTGHRPALRQRAARRRHLARILSTHARGSGN